MSGLVAGCLAPQAPGAPAGSKCFTIEDPYAVRGSWYRGNFHMHSSHSDGALFPEQLVAEYQKAGYRVLCISDHNSYGDQDGGIVPQLQSDSLLHDWNGDGNLHAKRQFGSGVEAYVRDYEQPPVAWSTDTLVVPMGASAHGLPVVLTGAEATWGGFHLGLVGCHPGPIEAPNTTLDMIPRTVAAGGFVFLAHPGVWNGAPGRLVKLLDLHAFEGLEIMNGLLLEAGAAADATPLWDGLLSAGYRLWGLANDDSHTWVGAPEAYPFTAFDLVKSSADSDAGFLEALHRGSFYGSTGLAFAQLAVEGDSLRVWAPHATRLRFIGRGGRVLLEVGDARTTYGFQGSEGYVRVEAVGKQLDGHSWSPSAWSQPFYVHAAPCPTTEDASSTPH